MNQASKAQDLLTIICPVYNEELAIPLFYERLKNVLSTMHNLDYELLFTNNRSTDGSLEQIKKLQRSDPKIRYLTFSRNFGYQASILGGLNFARGDASVIIDVDCEDPPELIPQFVQKWREGHDICYGIRGKRDEAQWITSLRLLFYRILKLTADTDIILDMAEFSLLARHVREILIKNSNTFPFLRAEIAYSGFKKVGIAYDRQKRIIGKSNYNLRGMAIFAAAGIMSVSTFPLRAAFYLYPAVLILNVLLLLLDYILNLNTFKGLVAFDLMYAIALASFQGLYIARIYKNGIGRPVYIVDWDVSDQRLGQHV
jgi:polyisoprenyl-phosphate glycosyltransferase